MPGLSGKVASLFLKALAMTARPQGAACMHDPDVVEMTMVRGDLIHCVCGVAITIPCQHTRAQPLLPKIFQCIDCGATFGASYVQEVA